MPFFCRQYTCRTALYNADMIDFLQQRKIFKRPSCFGCTRFGLSFKCAGSHHLFNDVAAVGAVSAGAFIKRTLTRQNRKVLRFHFRRSPRRTILALRSKKLYRFLHDLIPSDRRKIVFRLVAFMLCKHRVTVHHLANRAVVVFFHAARVGIDCLQQFSVFLGIICLAVAAETTALHQVQQNSGKVHRRYRAIQCLHTQGIDIRQVARLHRFFYFRSARQAVLRHQLIQVCLAPRASGFPPRRSKAFSGFGLLRLVKYARTAADQAIGFRVFVQRYHGPANRRNANIQANSIGVLHIHHTFSFLLLSYRIKNHTATDIFHENLTKKMTPCHKTGRQSFTVL